MFTTPVSHPKSDMPVLHPKSDIPVSHPKSDIPLSHPKSDVLVSHPKSDIPVYNCTDKVFYVIFRQSTTIFLENVNFLFLFYVTGPKF